MSIGGVLNTVKTYQKYGEDERAIEKESDETIVQLKEIHGRLPQGNTAPFHVSEAVKANMQALKETMQRLCELEEKSLRKFSIAGLKVVETGTETVAGPVAGTVVRVLTHNPKKSLENDEEVNLLPDADALVETVDKSIEKEIKKQVVKGVRDVAITTIGATALTLVSAPVLAVTGLAAVAGLTAYDPTLPKKAFDYTRDTFNGIKQFSTRAINKTTNTLLSTRQKVIQAYDNFENDFNNFKISKENLTAQNDLLKNKQDSLQPAKDHYQGMQQEENLQNGSYYKAYNDKEEASQKLNASRQVLVGNQKNERHIEADLNRNVHKLDSLKKSFVGCLINNNSRLVKIITCLFSIIFGCIKKARIRQDKLKNRIKELNVKEAASKANLKESELDFGNKESEYNRFSRIFDNTQRNYQAYKKALENAKIQIAEIEQAVSDLEVETEQKREEIRLIKQSVNESFEEYGKILISA